VISVTLLISILGAFSAVTVSILGAWYANRNNIILQTRKLKEDHYVSYIEALHDFASENKKSDFVKKYVFARDKLFIIASEEVVGKLLLYEDKGFGAGKSSDLHDVYLTELIKSIRADLKIEDKDFPKIGFKKALI
jgi:hypothetical protein